MGLGFFPLNLSEATSKITFFGGKKEVDPPQPTHTEELRSALCMINVVRKFIPKVSTILAPLEDLAKKDALKHVAKRWNSEHDKAFTKVKQVLTGAPVLNFPDLSKDFGVHVDASEAGVGAFLAQQTGDDLVIIAYFNKRFNDAQPHYFTHNEGMLCRSVGRPILAPRIMGQTFHKCDRSCCTKVPLLNARHKQYVDEMSDSVTILRLHGETQSCSILISRKTRESYTN